jgi:hypothetical protein
MRVKGEQQRASTICPSSFYRFIVSLPDFHLQIILSQIGATKRGN